MGASLGVIRDKVIATFSSKAGDPLVPLKHCCQVEMLAWVCWAVLGLWGPMCVSSTRSFFRTHSHPFSLSLAYLLR